MSLHPPVKALLTTFEARNLPPIEEQPLEAARSGFTLMTQKLNTTEDIYKVEDRLIKGFYNDIKLRIYIPSETKNLPALVYFHGGGWVVGNLDTHDALCRSLANKAEFIVVSVDYSLSPERKFPVAVEDSYLATKWVADHADELGIDKQFIAVGGDSAGGNLSAVVSYLSQLRKGPSISYQLLFYPSTGYGKTDSYEKYGENYNLNKSTMRWFQEQYLNSVDDMTNPLAAPMLIPDHETEKLPPAYILTAEYDPLCDGGENYATKLKNAGVDTTYVCYPGMIHGFLCMTNPLDDAKKAIKGVALELKEQYIKRVEGSQV